MPDAVAARERARRDRARARTGRARRPRRRARVGRGRGVRRGGRVLSARHRARARRSSSACARCSRADARADAGVAPLAGRAARDRGRRSCSSSRARQAHVARAWRDATWSPRGLFVARRERATRSPRSSPDRRRALAAAPPGSRSASRAGRRAGCTSPTAPATTLRIVYGNGLHDVLAGTQHGRGRARVAPGRSRARSRGRRRTARSRSRTRTRRRCSGGTAAAAVRHLAWSADGRRLFVGGRAPGRSTTLDQRTRARPCARRGRSSPRRSGAGSRSPSTATARPTVRIDGRGRAHRARAPARPRVVTRRPRAARGLARRRPLARRPRARRHRRAASVRRRGARARGWRYSVTAATLTGTPLVSMSNTAERFCACSTSARSFSSDASPGHAERQRGSR